MKYRNLTILQYQNITPRHHLHRLWLSSQAFEKPDVYAVGRVQVDDDDFNIFLTKVSRTYLFFKDKKSWKYIREYSLDKLAHKLSEAYDRIRS